MIIFRVFSLKKFSWTKWTPLFTEPFSTNAIFFFCPRAKVRNMEEMREKSKDSLLMITMLRWLITFWSFVQLTSQSSFSSSFSYFRESWTDSTDWLTGFLFFLLLMFHLLPHASYSPVIRMAMALDDGYDWLDMHHWNEWENWGKNLNGILLQESCIASAHHHYLSHPDLSKNVESGIDRGYFWLIKYIIKNWEDLKSRVDQETEEQTEIERNLMRERFLKFQKSREEDEIREREEEAADRMKLQATNGNAFIPIQEAIIEKSTVPAAAASQQTMDNHAVPEANPPPPPHQTSPKKMRFTKRIPLFRKNKVLPQVTSHKCHWPFHYIIPLTILPVMPSFPDL